MKNSVFYKLVKRDLILSSHSMKLRFIISFIVYSVLVVGEVFLLKQSAEYRELPSNSITILDVLYELLKGISFKEVEMGRFQLPVTWLILQLSYCFILGTYVRADFIQQTPYLLTRKVSRYQVLFSKFISTCILTICITLLFYIAVFFWGGIFCSYQFDWGIYTEKVNPTIYNYFKETIFIIKSFTLQLITSSLLVWVYLIVSTKLKSIISYIVIIVIITMTIFMPVIYNPFDSMLIRKNLFYVNNEHFLYSIFYFLLCAFFLWISGYWIGKTFEFVNRKDTSDDLH
ncbi:hypothetical protein [Bacillus wiedmannii]|uniref:hypothetical protein n=2 Tax=Bacillus wiedmannii TaxID=1890302 RepID=UPI000B440CBF|nr:hypothetical protein [Bacillus wiedmannii]MCX3312178.1 hypothetical protein [Bacillus wiedmannii]MED3079113.1 hypothetical protein [Bacillus wiedmannii]OUB82027.1 hypothetical protein BK788_23860 [Bacillus thuringiensis serovar sinensis]HDR7780543.1 hypothetical protein [Bacillus wiedmannii]